MWNSFGWKSDIRHVSIQSCEFSCGTFEYCMKHLCIKHRFHLMCLREQNGHFLTRKTWFWNNVKVSKWWQNYNFWVNSPFKNQQLKNYLLTSDLNKFRSLSFFHCWYFGSVISPLESKAWTFSNEMKRLFWTPPKMLQCSTSKHCSCNRCISNTLWQGTHMAGTEDHLFLWR